MGHRLSRIYTRTGDDGSTGLGDGSRVKKTGERIEAIGTVDERMLVLIHIEALMNSPEIGLAEATLQ